MEAYAEVLLYAVPGFFVLIVFEALYGWMKGHQTMNFMDTVSSLSSGITNTLTSVLGLVVVVVSYSWLVDKIGLVDIESTAIVYVLAFIGIDFASYWNHRLSHYMNIMWNRHIIHHSSEEFNLACALRQEISDVLLFSAIFMIPAALLGVPGKVVATVAPIHLFMQFWYHTRHIPKLGFLEYIIVTPSQHRVHHAINDEYIDKNLSAIFCVWDRMFGTFQEEMDDVPCVYGCKKAPNTWNPIRINFQHVWGIAKDAWRAESYWDKMRIWFMPTGWRPEGFAEKYPIEVIEDPYTYKKYDTHPSFWLKLWTGVQFLFTNLTLGYMLLYFSEIGFPHLFLYGAFLFVQIYAMTSLMDKEGTAWIFESIKSIMGLVILYAYGDWFGLERLNSFSTFLMGSYLILSVAVVVAFTFGVVSPTESSYETELAN